jgi:hypothetical protein
MPPSCDFGGEGEIARCQTVGNTVMVLISLENVGSRQSRRAVAFVRRLTTLFEAPYSSIRRSDTLNQT